MPEGSVAMLIIDGLGGPKPRPEGVGDGQSVEIPIPSLDRLSEAVTQEGRLSAPLVECV